MANLNPYISAFNIRVINAVFINVTMNSLLIYPDNNLLTLVYLTKFETL